MAKTIYHGEVLGSTNPAQLPDVSYRWGYLKAAIANSGNICIGSSSDVTLSGSSTDTNITGGLPLAGGDLMILDMLPLDAHPNLNEHWYISTAAGDHLTYYLVDW